MADLSIVSGSTSQSINVDLYVLSTGAAQTGLVYNSTSLTAYYSFTGANATSTAISLATLAAVTSAYSSGGFKELDATNMPGLYRLDLPTGALAASKGREVVISITGYSGMATRHIKIELTGWDNQNATNGGISALPATSCTSNASLLTSGTNTDQLSVTSGRALANTTYWNGTAVSSPATAGIPDINVKNMNNVAATSITTINANQGTTQPINFNGTAGSAMVKSDVEQLNTQTVTASGGVTFPAATLASTANITAGTITTVTNLTNAPTAGDFTATMKTSIGTAVAASAVASVTGNVGGNVTGSVGSVTGTVGSVTGAVGSISGVTFPTHFGSTAINASGAVTVDGTSALTESYSTQGSAFTLAQALYDLHQLGYQKSISGTTETIQKRDGSTSAKTITLNSATTPTSAVEAT